MNKREAKREAWDLVAGLLETYVDVGWPFESGNGYDDEGWTDVTSGNLTPDGKRIQEAIQEIIHLATERGPR